MKECNRYLDYLERSDSSCDSAEWQDIVAHAAQCPDCSMAMKNRGAMLEQLSALDEPEFPRKLHQQIISAVEDAVENENSSFNLLDKMLEKFLRPIEIGFSLACIIMIFTLVTAETNDSGLIRKKVKMAYKHGLNNAREIKPEEQIKRKDKNKLQALTKEEIEEFLVRLNRFNQMQNHKKRKIENEMPDLRLVDDWE
ncbi:MAG: hypothetical protein ACQETH_00335 [Candidatus Rifleibacteriota bacterium]